MEIKTTNYKFFQHKNCEFFPCHQGLAEDVLMKNWKTFLPVEHGHSFGMGHPNSMGIMILSSSLAFWIIIRPKRWWKTFISFEILAVITLWICLSRTSAILLAIFPFVSLGVQTIMKRTKRNLVLTRAKVPAGENMSQQAA